MADKESKEETILIPANKDKRPSFHKAVFLDTLPAMRRPLSGSRRLRPAPKSVPPAVAPPEEVVIAFEGWVEQVADGVATLRLADAQGRRSVATYAVADLERDSIPAQAGTAFHCQVIRNSRGFQVSFQPVPRRTLAAARRKQREDETIAAYGTLQNDY